MSLLPLGLFICGGHMFSCQSVSYLGLTFETFQLQPKLPPLEFNITDGAMSSLPKYIPR